MTLLPFAQIPVADNRTEVWAGIVFVAEVIGQIITLILLLPFGVGERAREWQLVEYFRHVARWAVYTFVGVNQVLQHVFSMPPWWNFGSYLLFPFGMAAILYLYITRQSNVFRNVIAVVVVVNLVMAGLSWLPQAGYVTVIAPDGDWPAKAVGSVAVVRVPGEFHSLVKAESTLRILWGTGCTVIGLWVMMAFHRLATARGWRLWVRVLAPLLVALVLDALLFPLACSAAGQGPYSTLMLVHLGLKLIVGLAFGLVVYWRATPVRAVPRGFATWGRWMQHWWVLTGFDASRRAGLTGRPADGMLRPMEKDLPTLDQPADLGQLRQSPQGLADSAGPTAYLAAVTKLAELWDQLYRDHPGKCVAVHGDGWFVVAADSAQLHALLTAKGVSSDEVEIGWLLLHMAPPRRRRRGSAA